MKTNGMKVLYVRVSTTEQNTGRQKVNAEKYDRVYEDKQSGAIAIEKRMEGARLIGDIQLGYVRELHINSIDRLGRDTIDVMNTLKLCEEKGVNVVVENMGIHSMDKDGKPNTIFKLISGIVSTLGEAERRSIAERCTQGRMIARKNGVRFGREKGSIESKSKFLSKPKVQSVVKILKRKPHLTIAELSAVSGVAPNTVMKVKRLVV